MANPRKEPQNPIENPDRNPTRQKGELEFPGQPTEHPDHASPLPPDHEGVSAEERAESQGLQHTGEPRSNSPAGDEMGSGDSEKR
jgi:hypothetical protein